MKNYFLLKHGIEMNEYQLAKEGEQIDIDYAYEEMMMLEHEEVSQTSDKDVGSRYQVQYCVSGGLTNDEIDDLISDWWGGDW
jgi:hypothetical protein